MMRRRSFFGFQEQPPDGFILVAVLWILGALATLAAIYTIYVKDATFSFTSLNDRLESQQLALAGIELAVYQLTANPAVRVNQGTFQFRLGKATVSVYFRSENSRIDLNLAPKQVFAGLFTSFGVERGAADRYADQIVAWRSPAPQGTADSEASLYRSAGLDYGPRHGRFQHINELGLVLGLPPTLIDRALPYLTVYSGQPEVNVLDAAPEVLAALPGLTPERLYTLIAQRQKVSQDVLNAQLGMAAQYITVQPGNSDRVTVDIEFDGMHMRSEAVILLVNGGNEPYRILSWIDGDEEASIGKLPVTSMR